MKAYAERHGLKLKSDHIGIEMQIKETDTEIDRILKSDHIGIEM